MMSEENWLPDESVTQIPQDQLVCAVGKNTENGKIERYCKKANGKKGCRNLAVKAILDSKKDHRP